MLVFPLWAVESVLELRDRLSQVAQTPGNGRSKHAEAEADVKRGNAKSRKSLFHFKPGKVNKFEYCNDLWKPNVFHNPVRKPKAWLYNNLHTVCAMCMQIIMYALGEGINCYKSLPKQNAIIKDLDNVIQDFKTVRLGL